MPGARRSSSHKGVKHGSSGAPSPGRRKSRQGSTKSTDGLNASPTKEKFQTISADAIPEAPPPGEVLPKTVGASERPTSPRSGGVVSIVDPGAQAGASRAPVQQDVRSEGAPSEGGEAGQRRSFAALKEKQLREHFDEMDLDGDGFLSGAEIKVALTEMDVRRLTDADLRRFFEGDESKISFDDFRDRKIVKMMKDLRQEKIQQELDSHGQTRGNRTVMPPTVMRRVVEFAADVPTLRAMCGTSRLWREFGSHDDVWKPLLVRRRRMEQGKSASSAYSLPELRVTVKGTTDGFFRWYLAWVQETSAERGNSALLKRLRDEMENNGEAIGAPTETVLCALTPLIYPPRKPETSEGAEGDLVDETPGPPPLPDVLTGDEKGFVQLRSLARPQDVAANLSEHDTVIECIVVSESFIYCSSQDCTITVWPRENLSRPQFTMIAHKESVSVLELAPWDERICVTGSMDRTAIIWNRVEMPPSRPGKKPKDGFALQITPKRVLEKGHTMKITAIVLHNTVIFTASRDCLVIIWDWGGKIVTRIEQHMGPVNCLCVANVPGPPAVEGAEEESEEESRLRPMSGPRSGRRATTTPAASEELQLRTQRTTRSPSAVMPNAAGSPLSGARALKDKGGVEDDGTVIASACGGGLVKGWNLRGKQQFSRRMHESPIEVLVSCPGLGVLASGSWDSTVALYNPKTGNMPCIFKGHDGVIRSIIVDEKRRRIISASDDKMIIIWDFVHIDLDCCKDLERTVLSPHLTLRGPKTPICTCSLVCMHDSRWHSLVAVAKSATLFLWRFNDQAQFQSRGMKLVSPQD